MAVNASFNGATIYRPGAYSHTTVDEGSTLPLGLTGVVLLIGESEGGVGIEEEDNLSLSAFTSAQMNDIKRIYRSGPLVDAALMAFAPASDAAIPNGANVVILGKTNSSVAAKLSLPNAYGEVSSLERGSGGNRITVRSFLSVYEGASISSDEIAAFGVALDGVVVSFYINGVKKSVILEEDLHDDINDLQVELADAFPELVISIVAGNKLKFVFSEVDAYKKGRSSSLESMDCLPLGLLAKVSFSVNSDNTIVVSQKREAAYETGVISGESVVRIACSHEDASFEINESKLILKENSAIVHEFVLADFLTLADLIEGLNLADPAVWSAELLDISQQYAPASALDQVVANCTSLVVGGGILIKRAVADVVDFFGSSLYTKLSVLATEGMIGDMLETSLSGGVKGPTLQASIIKVLDKSKQLNLNFIVPLFSQNSLADIGLGLTHSGSVYDIDAIHQIVRTHLSEMKTIKNRMERQAVLSMNKDFVSCRKKATETSDARCQLVFQDIRQVDALGNIRWFQPWALAVLVAGSRAGAAIGEPLTYKYLNTSDVRHQDFNPDVLCDQAIVSGLTFVEKPSTGGVRIVLDNTTYSRNDNWFWNRASCIYAGDIAMQNWRNRMETFVGRKNSIILADVNLVAANILREFRDQGIIVGNPGYRNLTVSLSGSTIRCTVTLILVEGIEFILTESTVARQTLV